MTPSLTHQDGEDATEARRRELEEMSRQLSLRLEEMIEDQNKRARDFIEQQHSLSPMPRMQVPVLAKPRAIAQPQAPKPEPSPFVSQQPVSSTVAPYQPAPPPVVSQQPVAGQSVSDAPPLPFEIPRKKYAKVAAAKDKLESSGGCIFALGVFLLFILIRSCN